MLVAPLCMRVHACRRICSSQEISGCKNPYPLPPPHTRKHNHRAQGPQQNTQKEKKKKTMNKHTQNPSEPVPNAPLCSQMSCTDTHTPAHTYTLPLHSKYTHSPTHMKNKHSHKIHPHMKTNAHSLDLTHTYSALLPHQSVCLTETHLYVRHFLWGKRG